MKSIKTLLAAAALTVSGLAVAGGETNSVVVKYGDLNLNSQAGIARLHKRISNAAESVCREYETRILGMREAYEQCVTEAVATGIAGVDNPNLNQYHASKGKRVVVASNQR